MKLKDLKIKFSSQLSERYPSEEIQSFFSILAEFFLNYSRFDTVVNADEIISEVPLQNFNDALERLLKNEPVQYITGETEFFSLPFHVNEHTLIPRPETEELVQWIVDDEQLNARSLVPRTLLDIGTGSGCIAISLAKNLNHIAVSALDISEAALQVAGDNAQRNQVAVDFILLDVLQAKHLPKQFDVIVSNPPYVRNLEKEQMNKNVLDYEPDSALFVSDEDPLVFYRKIAQLASQFLTPQGALYFEINEYLSKEMHEMLLAAGFKDITIKKDVFGKNRRLKCYKHE